MESCNHLSFLASLEDRETLDIIFLDINAQNVVPHVVLFSKTCSGSWIENLGTGVKHFLKCKQMKRDDSIVLTNFKSISGLLLSEFALLLCFTFTSAFHY